MINHKVIDDAYDFIIDKYGVNNHLSKEFGWSVICNDRVIEFAKREGEEFGWKNNWHSEYNGFVGYIRFYSQDVSKLPWDSTKTKIQSDSIIFLNIQPIIIDYSLLFRSDIKAAKKVAPIPRSPAVQKNKKVTKKKTSNKDSIPRRLSDLTDMDTASHSQHWKTLLPPGFTVTDKRQVLDNLIIEASTLPIYGYTHACAVLYRALLEAIFKTYVKEKKCFDDVKKHYYENGAGKKKNHSEEYKREQGIDTSMIIDWLIYNKNIFPQEHKKEFLQCLKDLKSDHIQKMNGVVHCRNIVGELEVEQMRNETIILIEYLINEISDE